MPARSRGFTLLEIIVVLLIMSFISLIMMQGLTHYLKVQERIVVKLSQSHVKYLQSSWLRDAVGGLVSSADPAWAFRGNESGIAGVSIRGLGQSVGIPERLVIRLEKHKVERMLTYYGEPELLEPGRFSAYQLKAEHQGWPLFAVQTKSHFEFVDVLGHRHAEWPPKNTRVKGLPEAIVLVNEEKEEGAKTIQWLSIKGDRRPPRGHQQQGAW